MTFGNTLLESGEFSAARFEVWGLSESRLAVAAWRSRELYSRDLPVSSYSAGQGICPSGKFLIGSQGAHTQDR